MLCIKAYVDARNLGKRGRFDLGCRGRLRQSRWNRRGNSGLKQAVRTCRCGAREGLTGPRGSCMGQNSLTEALHTILADLLEDDVPSSLKRSVRDPLLQLSRRYSRTGRDTDGEQDPSEYGRSLEKFGGNDHLRGSGPLEKDWRRVRRKMLIMKNLLQT